MAEPKGDYSDGKMIARITGKDKARKPPKPPPTTTEYARALGKSPSAGVSHSAYNRPTL